MKYFWAELAQRGRSAKKLNRTEQSKYPRLYFSPEQFNNQPLTTASDIYALTVLIYQLATGAWINGKSAPKTDDAIKRAHLEVTPPAPISLNKEIPDHFSRMILWALRKKPEDRLKTTTELLSSLALAARFSVDEIPLRATPTTASCHLGDSQPMGFPAAAQVKHPYPGCSAA